MTNSLLNGIEDLEVFFSEEPVLDNYIIDSEPENNPIVIVIPTADQQEVDQLPGPSVNNVMMTKIMMKMKSSMLKPLK